MKKLFLLVVAVALLMACQTKKIETVQEPEVTEAPKAKGPTLKLKWETDPVLTTCESVIYDKDNNLLYVANINGDPVAKDGNGFISKVTLDGKVSELQWIKGLNAPKGMGLANGKLYVTDIDQIREIDVASAKIVKSYPVQGAKFLNDITIDGSGKVYVSDMQTGDILMLENGKVSKWMTGVDGPNGLLAAGDQVMVLTWNSKRLNSIGVDKQLTARTDSIDMADGIEPVGDGSYLVSSWNGMVHLVDNGWKRTLLLDTRADSLNAADIEYIQEQNLLLVPTFLKNKVMAYELTRE